MTCLVTVIRILLTTCVFKALADGYLTGPLTGSSSLSYRHPLGRGVGSSSSSLRVSFEDTADTTTTIPIRPSYASIIPPSEASEIEEVLARSMLDNIKLVDVVISDPSSVSTVSSLPIPSSFAKFMPTDASIHASSSIPIVLIHGFDSSCLEYRRLAPLLGRHREVYVPDVLGWGFGDYHGVQDFSPAAKLLHMKAFLEQVVRRPCILVGASLGGAMAINLASEVCPELVDRVVLIDAQGFIDGKGKSNLPAFVAKVMVGVLRSRPLRMFANYLSYQDRAYATLDAMVVGGAHCSAETWERSSVDFLLSGGFMVSANVARVAQQTLVVWGRNDKILDQSFPLRFRAELPRSSLYWVERCGHVPHLERPDETAAVIEKFISAAQ